MKKTLEGAIELLAGKVDRLKSLHDDAELLLLKLLRNEKVPDPPRDRDTREPDKKPSSMIDLLYAIAEDMDNTIDRTGNVIVAARSMIS